MKELLYPPFLQWEVTSECNHNCIHCYNYWRKDTEKNDEVADHLSIAKKIVERHPVSVVITGGEPLLAFNSIKNSLKLLKDNGISLSINTNAVLVTDEIAEFLSEMNMSAFVSLPCSKADICDEITNVSGSLDRISKGIKILLKHNVKVTVNMVVSKKNLNYVYDTAKYAKEFLGIDRFFASRVSKPINSDKEFIKELLSKDEVTLVYEELLRISKELEMKTDTATPMPVCLFTSEEIFDRFAYCKNCTAGKTSYGLDCLGNIKACPRDVEIYGNILTDDFTEVWSKMKEWREGSFIPEECKSCNVRNLCNGGCRLDAYPITERRDSLDPIACLENVPIKFTKQENKKDLPKGQLFSIPERKVLLKEKYGWRISVGRSFLIITDELKNFLESRTKFCINDFMNEFDVEYSLANNAVSHLLAKGIISICE